MLADPGSWNIPADSVVEFANSFIYTRAQIANAIGKPFILEETGMDVRPLGPLNLRVLKNRGFAYPQVWPFQTGLCVQPDMANGSLGSACDAPGVHNFKLGFRTLLMRVESISCASTPCGQGRADCISLKRCTPSLTDMLK